MLALGLALCGAQVALAWLALRYARVGAADGAGTLGLITILVAAGGAWMLLLRWVPSTLGGGAMLAACIALGLAMRLPLLAAPPMYAEDSARYRWDGAVVRAGLDPYALPPAAAGAQRITRSYWLGRPDAPAAEAWALADLDQATGGLSTQVPYADLGTIYPPLAQAAFALAAREHDRALLAWRMLLLGAEVLALLLLLQLLGAMHENPLWSLLFWWNPLLIVQFAGSAHLDALLMPVLMAALWAAHCGAHARAGVLLALGAALKLWPLLLLCGLRERGRALRSVVAPWTLAVGLAAVLLWPLLRHVGDAASGLAAFSTGWTRNALAFSWLERALAWATGTPQVAATLARALIAAIITLLALRLALRGSPAGDLQARARNWTLVIAALFLLGPTAFPWYYAWFLPLLCLWRQPALLALTTLLPLYYARFPLEASAAPRTWRDVLLAVEFLPVWIGLGWAWRTHRRAQQPAA